MRAAITYRSTSDVQSWMAVASVVIVGCGLIVALAGSRSDSTVLALWGSAAVAAALVFLLAGRWIESLPLLAVSLPLPAFVDTDSLRVAPAAALTVIVLLAWFFERGPAGGAIPWHRLPTRPLFALAGAVVLSSAFAQHRGAAAREMVNWFLFLTLLVAVTDTLVGARRSSVRRLALLLVGVVGAAGAFGVLEALGVLPGRFPLGGTRVWRATGGFGWPNELGMFLAVGIPLCVYPLHSSVTRGIPRLLAWLALSAALFGLMATFSRGSWLSLLAATPILLLIGQARVFLRAGVVALSAAVLMELVTGGALSSRVTGTLSDPYVAQRMALTFVGVLMFRENPIVGIGPGGYAESLEDFGPQLSWLWDYVGSAHNTYVEIAAEMGLIGLIAFVALLAVSLWRLVSAARRAGPEADPADLALRRSLAWSFTVVVLVSFTAWPLAHGISQLIILVLAMGLAIAPEPGDAAHG